MATAMKFYAAIAARHGVDATDDEAIDEFFATKVPGLSLNVQTSILSELLEHDGEEAAHKLPRYVARTNVLSKDVEIKGNIKFTNELVIDGKIEGEISSDGVLTVGENADIRGEIKTKSVIVYGKVNGNITVGDRCELRGRAHLVGDLKAARLVLEEGATFVGKSEVTINKNALPKTPSGLNLPTPAAKAMRT